jgi:cell division protein FtsQ
MKINYNYIKGFLLLAVIVFLFGFAKKRNSAREISKVEVKFTDSENLYITEQVVNKLLIQNNVKVASKGKETLDLNKVEAVLNNHEMIENAEVYLTLDGAIKTKISQRKPIGRILGGEGYYVDRLGDKMPLSPFYSARVPILKGIEEKDLSEVYPLLKYINSDQFLTEHVTAIDRLDGGLYQIEIRQMDFNLVLGKIDRLDNKFNNFKAFYKKALKDEKLNTYKVVDLQFGNQVVCTKK